VHSPIAAATPAPVALFVYKRPVHVRRTVEALAANELASQSDLLVFCDGPRGVQDADGVAAVCAYVDSISGFRSVSIFRRERNAGLARSIIEGVTRVCEQHERVIVLEDDMVTSRWFLTYMNDALELYRDDARVASIHGYCYPVSASLPETFFLRGADCWGWATWRRAWSQFEPDGRKLLDRLLNEGLGRAFDLDGGYGFTQMLRDQISGKNDSWAVRWHASCFLAGTLTLYPGTSLVDNVGNDASGTHSDASSKFAVSLANRRIRVGDVPVEESRFARGTFADFLRGTSRGHIGQLIARLRRRIGSAARKRSRAVGSS
jgi:hypothetical protein